MAEVETPVQSTEQQAQTAAQTVNPFAGNAWTETIPQPEPVEKPKEDGGNPPVSTEPPPQQTTPIEKTDEEILDANEWLKREFNWESAEEAKAEVEQLRSLKEKTPEEIKFADEQSKQIYELLREGKRDEVLSFLDMQRKLDNYLTGDVTKDNAEDVIKLGMKLKYPTLTDSEINYKFNKDFGVPPAPVMGEDELQEEFENRKQAWQEKVNDISQARIIEAKLSQPELQKAKSQLSLPEITPKTAQSDEPTPEQIEAMNKARDLFLNKLESDFSKAEGFTVSVKDESVDIPVAFKIPDEDKVAIKNRLKDGFDLNNYMDKRWFDESGNPKIEQMISDLFILENPDKILSGIANNAANQRLQQFIKQSHNPELNGKTHQQTFNPQQGNSVSPFAKNAWSEKPPANF